MVSDASGPLGGQSAGVLIGLAVLVPILLLRNARPRKLKLELLWVRPAIWALAAVLSFSAAPPAMSPLTLGALGLALILGAALGWQRGRLMRIAVDPDTHNMTLQASPAAMIFIVALFALRTFARGAGLGGIGPTHAPVSLVVDVLILFSLAMMLAQSFEIGLRGRLLLAAARTGARQI